MFKAITMLFTTISSLLEVLFKGTKALNNMADVALDASANYKAIAKLENRKKLDTSKKRLKLTEEESKQVDADAEQAKEENESRLP